MDRQLKATRKIWVHKVSFHLHKMTEYKNSPVRMDTEQLHQGFRMGEDLQCAGEIRQEVGVLGPCLWLPWASSGISTHWQKKTEKGSWSLGEADMYILIAIILLQVCDVWNITFYTFAGSFMAVKSFNINVMSGKVLKIQMPISHTNTSDSILTFNIWSGFSYSGTVCASIYRQIKTHLYIIVTNTPSRAFFTLRQTAQW